MLSVYATGSGVFFVIQALLLARRGAKPALRRNPRVGRGSEDEVEIGGLEPPTDVGASRRSELGSYTA